MQCDAHIQTARNSPRHLALAHPARQRGAIADFAFLGCWGLCLATAFTLLAGYSLRDGAVEPPPTTREVGLETSANTFTLVMAVHPKCPCTDASKYELERLLAKCPESLAVVLLVYRPHEDDAGWGSNNPVGSIADLPQVRWQWDTGSTLARELGCQTSGSVVLFDPRGNPEFWGGITAARGHAGDNIGSKSILGLVRGEIAHAEPTPVFGCDLRTPEACAGSSCRHEGEG